MADTLAPIGPLPVVVSPLRRTRETAQVLVDRWEVEPAVDERVGEIPSPDLAVSERGPWLMDLFRRPWDDWPDDLQQWRQRIPETLLSIPQDTVVVSHFVFIGHAAGDPSYRPDYCSITQFEHDGSTLRLVGRGDDRATIVL